MCSMLKTDFVSVFSLPVFSLDDQLIFSEVNAAFSEIFGDIQGKHVSVVSDEFNQRKCARKINARQAYRFKIFTADKRKTPYSAELRFEGNQYVGFAVEAADAAKAEAMLASYSEIMEKQNRIAKAEKNNAKKLLRGLLPEKTINELQSISGTAPKTFETAGLLMLTLPHIPDLTDHLEAEDLFAELDELFTCFDLLVQAHSCERLEATADRYLAAAPLLLPASSSCEILANLALDIVEVIKLRQSPILMPCKVGLHMGQLITGIVGKARLSLSAIGSGVSQVTDIAGQAEVMQVNCSEAVYQQGGPLKNFLHQHQAGHNAEDAKNLYRLDPDFGIRDTDQLQDVILRAKTLRRSFQ